MSGCEQILRGCFASDKPLPCGGRDIDPDALVRRFDEGVQGMFGRMWSKRKVRYDGFRGACWESAGFPVAFTIQSPREVTVHVDGLGWCQPEPVYLTFSELEARAADALAWALGAGAAGGGVSEYLRFMRERSRARRIGAAYPGCELEFFAAAKGGD